MLTMCRSLLGNPLVMLIDEPTEGLAPKIVQVVGDAIRDIHGRGVSVVLVEQKLAIALKVSSRVCVMGHGRIVFEGTPHDLTSNPQLMKDWLAVRSAEHTSALQSLMRISYAVFCLTKKNKQENKRNTNRQES